MGENCLASGVLGLIGSLVPIASLIAGKLFEVVWHSPSLRNNAISLLANGGWGKPRREQDGGKSRRREKKKKKKRNKEKKWSGVLLIGCLLNGMGYRLMLGLPGCKMIL